MNSARHKRTTADKLCQAGIDLLMHTDNFKESIFLFNLALEYDSKHAWAAYSQGFAYTLLKKPKSALKWFKTTLKMDPCHEQARNHLSYLEKTID